MPKFTLCVDYGVRVADGGNRDDIAAGEGWETETDKIPFTGSFDLAILKARKLKADYSLTKSCVSCYVLDENDNKKYV